MKTFTEWLKNRENLSEAISDEFPQFINQALKMLLELRGSQEKFNFGPVTAKDNRTGTNLITRTIEDLKGVMQNLGNYAVPRPRDLIILKSALNIISNFYHPKEIGQEFVQRASNILGIELMKPIEFKKPFQGPIPSMLQKVKSAIGF